MRITEAGLRLSISANKLGSRCRVVGRPTPPAGDPDRDPPSQSKAHRGALASSAGAARAAPAVPGNPLTAAAGRRRRVPPPGWIPGAWSVLRSLTSTPSKYTAGPFFSTAWNEASGINTQRFRVIQLTERNNVHLSDRHARILMHSRPFAVSCPSSTVVAKVADLQRMNDDDHETPGHEPVMCVDNWICLAARR